MGKLLEYIRSLNPKKDQSKILLYGSTYRLWREGKYLGEAVWTEDTNVGDSFQTTEIVGKFEMVNVWIADKWELVINKK